jgi:hypothetical protein
VSRKLNASDRGVVVPARYLRRHVMEKERFRELVEQPIFTFPLD